ncbi:hypothetical protein ABT112_03895 [Streptomyces sp. NPDC002055]|uniref:tetratricopeptide repeat protein n=1 Tax=Streptomyces sp. NPDC002055 TaxID=3154534 RepID=UPI0033259B9B
MGRTPDIFEDLRRVGTLKRTRLGRRPTDSALGRLLTGVKSRNTVGSWLRGEHCPTSARALLTVVGEIREEARRQGILGTKVDPDGPSEETVAELLAGERWEISWKAEQDRRAAPPSPDAAVRGQARAAVEQEERRAREAAEREQRQALRAALPDRPRPLRSWGAQRLGVHRAISGLSGTDATSEFVLPHYVPRPHDLRLRERLVRAAADGAPPLLVVVRGGSCTGKTRTAFEALRAAVPEDFVMLCPADGDGLLAALAADAVAPGTVVWLDEAQDHLTGPAGEAVAAGLLRRLDGDGPLIVIATLWPDRHRDLTAAPRQGDLNDPHRQARILLEQAHNAHVPDTFSDGLDAVRAAAGHDPALAAALRGGSSEVTQELTAAAQLVDHYESPSDAAGVYGKALITVALDASRLGAAAPLPYAFLEAAAFGYLTERRRAAAVTCEGSPDHWFTRGLGYARTVIRDVTSALQDVAPASGMGAVPGVVRPADYLRQHGERTRAAECPPAGFWDAAAGRLTVGSDLRALAEAAEQRGRYRCAAVLLHRAAEAGDRDAMVQLARLLERADRRDEAVPWWRCAADAGDPRAMALAGAVAAREGRADEALSWWEAATAAGDREAPVRAAHFLRGSGREEAGVWWERAEQMTHGYTSRRILDVLVREGRSDEALAWLRDRHTGGGISEVCGLAGLLQEQGHTEEAIRVWQRLAEECDWEAPAREAWLRTAAELLIGAGRADEAIGWLRGLAERGDTMALPETVRRWVALRPADEAVEWLKAYALSHRAVNDTTAVEVAELLEADGRVEEAIAWLKERADDGDCAALDHAVGMLHGRGRGDEALTWLASPSAGSAQPPGGARSLRRMAGLLQAQGYAGVALLLMRECIGLLGGMAGLFGFGMPESGTAPRDLLPGWDEAAASGDASALLRAALLIDVADRYDDVRRCLTDRGDGGPRAVHCGDAEDVRQVGRWLRERADSDDPSTVFRTAGLAADAGRSDEALTWYARLDARGYRQAWREMTALLDRTGRTDALERELLKVVGEGGWYAQDQLTELLGRTRRTDGAVAYLRTCRDVDHSALVARLYTEAHRTDDALTAWQQYADRGDGYGYALKQAVALLRDAGRSADARRLLRYGWEPDGTPAEPWEVRPPRRAAAPEPASPHRDLPREP